MADETGREGDGDGPPLFGPPRRALAKASDDVIRVGAGRGVDGIIGAGDGLLALLGLLLHLLLRVVLVNGVDVDRRDRGDSDESETMRTPNKTSTIVKTTIETVTNRQDDTNADDQGGDDPDVIEPTPIPM